MKPRDGVLAVTALAWLTFLAAGPPPAAVPGLPKPAELQTPAQPAGNLDEQYAAIAAKLAQLDLQEANATNQRVRGGVPAAEVERLAQLAAAAEKQLQQVRTADRDQSQWNLAVAQANLTQAQSNWQRAGAANQRIPGSVNATELERLRLLAEEARVARDQAQANRGKASDLVAVQWQLDRLREEVSQLRNRVDKSGGSRPSYYYYSGRR